MNVIGARNESISKLLWNKKELKVDMSFYKAHVVTFVIAVEIEFWIKIEGLQLKWMLWIL